MIPNFYELPFRDLGWFLAKFDTDELAIVLNKNEAMELSSGAKERIEQHCVGFITHETLHGILFKVEGRRAYGSLDKIDNWSNDLQLSAFTVQTEGRRHENN